MKFKGYQIDDHHVLSEAIDIGDTSSRFLFTFQDSIGVDERCINLHTKEMWSMECINQNAFELNRKMAMFKEKVAKQVWLKS